jgi:hypothetical protein
LNEKVSCIIRDSEYGIQLFPAYFSTFPASVYDKNKRGTHLYIFKEKKSYAP